MRRRTWTKVLVVLLSLAYSPALAFGQQPPRPAGVVTALRGEAVVTRAALPQPKAVNFRDDVFTRDRISTREQSLVRVLLGGKAVVTVRELSNLTITEEPGRPSVIDLLTGKIALVAARFRMASADAIEIRTPNAVAAIRGTVAIVEVRPEPTASLAASAALDEFIHAIKDELAICPRPVPLVPPPVPPVPPLLPCPDPVMLMPGQSLDVGRWRVFPSPPLATLLAGLTAPFQFSATPAEALGALIVLQQTRFGEVAAFVNGQALSSPLPGPPIPTNPPPSTSTINVNATNASQAAGAFTSGGGTGGAERVVCSGLANCGFENGFQGWSVFDQPGGSGGFFLQSGTISPISLFTVPAPPEGTRAAMSDQFGPGSHILYRDITVPSRNPILQFRLFVGNQAGAFFTPNNLDFSLVDPNGQLIPNQQARVDIMNIAAGIQDVGAGVLRNLYQTQPGDPPVMSGYNTFAFDLSQFAGQTVRLRFSEVDNQFFFQLGVDAVSLFPALNSGIQ